MSDRRWEDDEYISISALQHFVFCERQVALIYIERAWDDNPYTVEGQHIHAIADSQTVEVRGNVRIARGLYLKSSRLGIFGKADIVEFHKQNESSDDSIGDSNDGISLEGAEGFWLPFPIEYKRGRRRHVEGNEVQVCAQALCLEEMLGTTISSGAIYYGKSGRRQLISIDKGLREKTEAAIVDLRKLLNDSLTPSAFYSKKCESCSLIDTCLPKTMSVKRSVERYLSNIAIEGEGGIDEATT